MISAITANPIRFYLWPMLIGKVQAHFAVNFRTYLLFREHNILQLCASGPALIGLSSGED